MPPPGKNTHVLVLGGYGLIGSAITKRLMDAGYSVTGLGRSASKGAALLPKAHWIGADISALTQAIDWEDHLSNIDVVINASGALQNGLKDRLVALQEDSIIALIQACESNNIKRFIQISAPDANLHSSTLFYRTKAAADEALKASQLDWTIFRPGLVISPHAYGGTSLIRQLAAMPIIQPIMMGKVPIQTIAIDDVAQAVCIALKNNITAIDVDLVEDGSQTLLELTLSVRKWLGFKPPKAVLNVPNWIGRSIAWCADVAGWLGWRAPLRSTALTVLTQGVTGSALPWQSMSNTHLKTLEQTLYGLPSTLQERIFARVMLLFPILILTLSGFWIVSGVIGTIQQTQAVETLNGVLPDRFAQAFVLLGSVADILIGIGLLIRPLTRKACWASIILSSAYLVASVWLTPHLWADPLGPMVKVFPAIALALMITALMEAR